MDKQSIINRLITLPVKIAAAEAAVLQANSILVQAKATLQEKEDALLLGNVIDGKNAEIRAAQLRQHTHAERERLEQAEFKLKQAALELGVLKDEFRALRAVAELLKEAV